MSAELKDLPVGSVMPFQPDLIPENWMRFDGNILFQHDYPEVYEKIKDVEDLWEAMGGRVEGNAIILPYVSTHREAMNLAYGTFTASKLNDVPMEIAIKVKKDV